MIIISIISFIVIFSIVVFIHEFWHYFIAKKCWVKIEEFAIWLPPLAKLIHKNELWERFVLNWIPFWGYVKMYWESYGSGKTLGKWAFCNASILKRCFIVIAGVTMNFISAWVILSILFTIWTKPIIISSDDFDKYSKEGYIISQSYEWIRVVDFVENSRGKTSWLEVWDIIQSVNWFPVNINKFTFEPSQKYKYKVLRWESQIQLEVETNSEWKIWAFITDKPIVKEIKNIKIDFYKSPFYALNEMYRISTATIKAFWWVISNIFSKWKIPDEVSWPVGIASLSWQISMSGDFNDIFKFIAMISLSLWVLNLMPIPALDGWHLLFLWIEAIIWRRARVIWTYAQVIWFALLFILMILVTFSDIAKLFS